MSSIQVKDQPCLQILNPEKAKEFYRRVLHEVGRSVDYIDKIRTFRVVLDQLFEEICREEKRTFSSTFSRILFISDKYGVPGSVKQNVHALRKFANGHAHDFKTITSADYAAFVRILSQTIFYFSESPIPVNLPLVWEKHPDHSLDQKTRTIYENMEFDRAVVTGLQFNKKFGKWILNCESEIDLGSYQVVLSDASYKDQPNKSRYGQKFSKIGEQLWLYATLHFFKLSKSFKQEQEYHSYYESLIIVEPDFLVDASFLARSFLENKTSMGKTYVSNPDMAFLERLRGVKPHKALFTGALANELLDKCLIEEELDFVPVFKDLLRGQVWNAIQLGSSAMREIRDDLRDLHLPNLLNCRTELLKGKASVEPAFYSAEYGLQGRLDVLLEQEDDKWRKEIIELKSGRPPEESSEVKPEHAMQVIAYNMLLKSVYGRSRKGASTILYSKASEAPLRNVESDFRIEQDLMMARNELIGRIYSLANRDFSSFEALAEGKFGQMPFFINQQRLFFDFQEAYTQATDIEKAYFNEFSAFILRELQTGKVGDTNPREGNGRGFSGLWHYSEHEKKKRFAILTGLKFKEKTEKEAEFKFTIPVRSEVQFSSFRKGDIALIYPNEKDKNQPLSHQILKCSLSKISPNELTLKLRNPQIDQDMFHRHAIWVLEPDFLDKSYYIQLQSMYRFLEAPIAKKAIILGQKEPRFKEENEILGLGIMDKQPSHSQTEAIQKALSAEDFLLIQGPPGTGKTSRVLTYILLHLFRYSQERIVVLAFTNKAVEKILHELELFTEQYPELDYIHLASKFRHSENSLSSRAQEHSFNQVSEFLNNTRLFIGTISSFQSHQNLLHDRFRMDTLIIDEASQLVEPLVAGIIPRFRRFIMVGDHNQLPAICTQRDSRSQIRNPLLENIGIGDLRVSLFERLWKQALEKSKAGGPDSGWAKCTYMLNEQFRMHEDIAELINPYYNHALKMGKPKLQSQGLPIETEPENALQKLLAQNRLIFICSPQGKGKSHVREARRAKMVLQALRKVEGRKFDPEKSVGVITPWRAQINSISKEIGIKSILNQVTIDTVERFQGSERKTILISLATSDSFYLNLLSSLCQNEHGVEVDRKLNVSISRAQERLVILGEESVLRESKHYRDVLRGIHRKGAYLTLEDSWALFQDREDLDEDIIF